MPICRNPWCAAPFEVYPEDRARLKTFDVDRDPDQCPMCRHQYRGMFYPQLSLHRATSALSGKPIISIYNPKTKLPVYAIDEWWSDAWDGVSFGRPFDFSKPFFDQFAALFSVVPKMANQNNNAENSEYSFSAGNSRNVYYSMSVHRSEDMYYCERTNGYNRMLCDCLKCHRSDHLYECVQCRNCHTSTFLHQCSETRDSHYCVDCRGCSDCMFCSNLRNKSFHIFNKPVSKEEYAKLKAQYLDGNYSTSLQNLDLYRKVRMGAIWNQLSNQNCENCVGDALMNCANCFECYHSQNSNGNRYCIMLTPSEKNVSSMDLTTGGIGELLYHSLGLGGGNYFLRMCAFCRLSSQLTYCIECSGCKNCFGCTGLRSKQYCILNKQYSKEEYEALVPKVVDQLKRSGEWGSFFPIAFTPFAYNESFAMTIAPLSKEEVLRREWRWEELPDQHPDDAPHTEALPDSIEQTPDAITTKALVGKASGKKYKIIPQELAFYREMRIPIPREHPDERMARRRGMMNPYRLWERPCAKCGKQMKTSFAPDRPEIVYCEECYLKEVY